MEGWIDSELMTPQLETLSPERRETEITEIKHVNIDSFENCSVKLCEDEELETEIYQEVDFLPYREHYEKAEDYL